MSELLKINVNDHTEKKNNLTYLSWAWAWAKVLELDPQATWEAAEFNGLPACFLPDTSAMVKTTVTIKGHTKSCWLPVMNHRNQAIKGPDAFAINTAIVRCLTKTISMHGLGLYIYAGEDLPEGEEKAPEAPPVPKISATTGAMEDLSADQREYLQDMAMELIGLVKEGRPRQAYEKVEADQLDDVQKTALWSILDSKTRSAIKAARAVPV